MRRRNSSSETTVAIACQGGGSHCAYGAGALIELLSRLHAGTLVSATGTSVRVVGLSGTSGGAINALLAWCGIAASRAGLGAESLDAFWHDMMASDPWDAFGNAAMVSAMRWQGLLPTIELAPNAVSAQAQAGLGERIRKHLPVPDPQSLAGDDTPDLYVGAADVESGAFTVFGGRSPPTIEQVLASAAVPELFPAVRVGERSYWDGLLSQNPPIRDFLRGRTAVQIPDEIWIVRINPVTRATVPTQLNDIRDRRNEMAGNLALAEEIYFIDQVNKWLAAGHLPGKKHVSVREIPAFGLDDESFDYASKLDRSPAFIENLLRQGRAAAAAFFDARNRPNRPPASATRRP